MKITSMRRMHRALTAMKTAEMAALGAAIGTARAARAEADALRAISKARPAADTPTDMAAESRWQQDLGRRARSADATAAAAEVHVASLRARLARTLGREIAVTRIIARAEAAEMRLAARRLEDQTLPPRRLAQSSVSKISASSAGIA